MIWLDYEVRATGSIIGLRRLTFKYIFIARAIGVSTNSKQEVGEIYRRALRDAVPDLTPYSYLGDAAEAFANAALVVFDSITTRLMCYAHVYKVAYYKVAYPTPTPPWRISL